MILFILLHRYVEPNVDPQTQHYKIMLSYASSDDRIKESDFSKAPALCYRFVLFTIVHVSNHRLRPDNIEDNILASGHLTS
uniref:Ovule protein n=1 Tax=Haemonchus contortus TaxID=6289 RepID=A0A7I4Y026_HAECO